MKVMTKNIPRIIILMLLCCCTLKTNLNKPVFISHKSQNIEVNFEINKVVKIKKKSWEKSGENRYFYYGLMTSKLSDKRSPKSLKLVYKNEISEVHLDTIASVINFWDASWYDSNNFREDKIYVVFDNPNIDWSKVQIVESDIHKPITRADVYKTSKDNNLGTE